MNFARYLLTTAISLVALLGAASTCAAATFSESFGESSWSPSLVATTPAGYLFSISADQLIADKVAGTRNGLAMLTTNFKILGDFTVTTEVSRPNLAGNSDAGIWVDFGRSGNQYLYSDIFFFGAISVNSNIDNGQVYQTGYIFTGAPTVTLKIQRIGNTLSQSFDVGAGFQTITSATDVSLSAPVQALMFIDQEFGSTLAARGTFDNFNITADNFAPVPEPQTVALFCVGLAVVATRRPRIASRS